MIVTYYLCSSGSAEFDRMYLWNNDFENLIQSDCVREYYDYGDSASAEIFMNGALEQQAANLDAGTFFRTFPHAGTKIPSLKETSRGSFGGSDSGVGVGSGINQPKDTAV